MEPSASIVTVDFTDLTLTCPECRDDIRVFQPGVFDCTRCTAPFEVKPNGRIEAYVPPDVWLDWILPGTGLACLFISILDIFTLGSLLGSDYTIYGFKAALSFKMLAESIRGFKYGVVTLFRRHTTAYKCSTPIYFYICLTVLTAGSLLVFFD